MKPLSQAQTLHASLRLRAPPRITLGGNNFSKTILLTSLGSPPGADSHKCPGLDDKLRLGGRHQRLQKFQHLDLGGHGIKHAPALWIGTLRRSFVILRLHHIALLAGVAQDTVLLLLAFEFPADVEQDYHAYYHRKKRH